MIAEIVNPDYRFSSIVKITPEWLRVHKFCAILMDIDNTLVARNSWVVPELHLDWLQKMQEQGICIVLASNNGGKRLDTIEKQLTDHNLCIPVFRWAGKPLPQAYSGAIRMLEDVAEKEGRSKLDPANCPNCILAAGDQLFTDVLGAHWYHLPAAWIRPLSQNDFIGTKLLRLLEKCVSWYLDKKRILPEEDCGNVNNKLKESRF